MRNALALVALLGSTSLLGLACGGGGKGAAGPAPAPSGSEPRVAPAPSGSEPRVAVEDAGEAWVEEASGKAGEKGTSVREFKLDVTKRVEWKGGAAPVDAGPPPADRVLRVAVRFPVPKVLPKDARDPHVVNRLLWDVRSDLAKCFYKGPGREPGDEMTMVAALDVAKGGEIQGASVESADERLKKSGADQCILENVKGLKLAAAGDDAKVRFKLKLQTTDVTGQPDAKPSK
jgi:hypothetical protein